MKFLLVFSLVICAVGLAKSAKDRENLEWKAYKEEHGKKYHKTRDDNAHRSIWEKNKEKVE